MSTLDKIAIKFLEHSGVESACVSHFSNDDIVENWDTPTLWVHVWRGTELHELLDFQELELVSDGRTDIGPVYGFQLA